MEELFARVIEARIGERLKPSASRGRKSKRNKNNDT